MEDSSPQNPVGHYIIEAIRFLAALEAQLRDSPDHEAMAMERYGLIVPVEAVAPDTPPELIQRMAQRAEQRDLAQADTIRAAIQVLRELLERREFTEKVASHQVRSLLEKPRLDEGQLRAAFPQLGISPEYIEDALKMAKEVHGRSTRDDGAPYLEEHVFPIAHDVAFYLSSQSQADSKQIIAGIVLALLHDSLEDSNPGSEANLRNRIDEVYGAAIADGVVGLTKKPRSQYGHLPPDEAVLRREEDYMLAIKEAPYLVRLVKVFDRINNLLCLHASPQAGKADQYIEETLKYHLPLASAVDPALA